MEWQHFASVLVSLLSTLLKRVVTWVERAEELSGLRVEQPAVSGVALLTIYKAQRCEQFKLQLN